jgi:hypothetical protein
VALLALLGAGTTWAVVSSTRVASARRSPFSGVVVIGASASAGSGTNTHDLQRLVTLADVIDASVRPRHPPVRSLASVWAYRDFGSYLRSAFESIAKEPPSVLVAVDLMFLAIHGAKSNLRRQEDLDEAFDRLETLQCPILLGDVPDVTAAALANPELARTTMPPAALRDDANARIRRWAQRRSNVTLVPLSDLVARVTSGQELSIRGSRWPPSEVGRLMQADHLHPTMQGLVALWLTVADTWLRSDPELREADFDLDAHSLWASVARRRVVAKR